MRRNQRFVFAAMATGLAIVACDISSIVDPGELRRLAEAEAKWKARPFSDYSYEIRVACFCPPEITQWVRVTVRAGAVVSAVAVDPNSNYPVGNLQFWSPIDSLFVNLRRAITDRASQSYLDAIIADYDADLGYPTNIEYRAKANVIDGGSQFSLRNVRPPE